MLHNRLFFDLLWSLLLYMKMLMFRLLVVRKHPASRLRLFQFTVKIAPRVFPKDKPFTN